MSHSFRMFSQETSKALIRYLGDRSVLVIDPSANYRNSLKQFFTNLKISQVRCVSDVREARRLMLTIRFGLLVVEWLADNENGLQFCRNLQRENKEYENIPYLLLGSDGMRQDVVLASEVGVSAYLLKPFSYENFVEKMSALMKEALNPNPVTMKIRHGFHALEQNLPDIASVCFREALTADPSSARAYRGLAEIEIVQKKLKAAIQYLHTALSHNPNFIEAHRRLLWIFERQGDDEGMMRHALILNKASPDNPRYTLVLATLYMKQHDLSKSERYFRRTIQLAPSISESYKGLGHIAVEHRQYERAARFFKKALDLNQNDASTLNSLGLAYINIGEYDKGIEKYRMALNLQPDDYRILFNIGQAYERQERFSDAKSFYENALIRYPGFEKALRGLRRSEEKLKLPSDDKTKTTSQRPSRQGSL